MQVIRNLARAVASQKPGVLTIGNFDGVHRGHQAVLAQAAALAHKENRPWIALTFENHPSEILRSERRTPLICTLPHKTLLLQQAGVDWLILIPFTKELSQQSAEFFLQNVYETSPFVHLILGHDAALGKDRQGDNQRIQEFASAMHFDVACLESYTWKDQIVSSSRIRTLLQQGDLTEVADLLGRNYSIYGAVISGAATGKQLGYPTINIDVSQLCLPPFGVYAVRLMHEGVLYNGVANLGLAPTVRNDQRPLLEVHLLDIQKDLYGQFVEVVFHQYIRPEKQFPSLQALREQIHSDAVVARRLLNASFV